MNFMLEVFYFVLAVIFLCSVFKPILGLNAVGYCVNIYPSF